MTGVKPIVTDNFKRPIPNAVPEAGDLLDKRSGVYARNAKFSMEAYLAYIDMLSDRVKAGHYNPRSAFMLKLGFIPVIMPPSFWALEGISLVSMLPPTLRPWPIAATSFDGRIYTSPIKDCWVSKMDVSALLGIPPEEVTVRKVFEYVQSVGS